MMRGVAFAAGCSAAPRVRWRAARETSSIA
jgi:hypothetical protein